MPIFLILMFIGIFGLGLMAVPGLNRHGHGAHMGHVPLHIGHGAAHSAGHISTAGSHGGSQQQGSAEVCSSSSPAATAAGLMRWIPSPRVIFSLLTLYGGFGVALTEGAHLPRALVAILALIPAALFERFAVTPLWNGLMTFEGQPSSPLEEMTFQEAEAVTPFRNGKGMVSVVRDGRAVQFRACLPAEQSSMPVRVGDKLRIEQVDAEHERVTVTLN